jgi:hypothetical protein
VNTRPRAQPDINNRVESLGTGRSWAESGLDNAATSNSVRSSEGMAPAYRGGVSPSALRAGGRDPGRGIELRRARPARPDAGGERTILELDAAGSAAQQQPAAAHVATPDEFDRKAQPAAEDR